ncbi:hypothetical protein HY406_01295 [Candidatus Giovannonibacteria bacterium]|nr:hypothetical protein [Candidatus Giovannonibacteria bacterium]
MALFSSSQNLKNILVIDVGTASVNALWVRAARSSQPEIVFSSRAGLRLLENPDFRSMWRYVKEALLGVIAALKREQKRIPFDLVFVVFSSPWYVSQTRIVKMERLEPFTVSQKLFDDMISEELELFRARSQEKFALSSENISVMERAIMKTSLNGYPVPGPLKKKTRQLELALYASLARKELLEDLENFLEQQFGRVGVKMNSSPLAFFGVLKDMVGPEEGFLLVDIGGEITEISLIQHGIIEEVLTFARGGHFIVRRLASSLGVGLEEALSLLKSKSRGDLKNSLDQKISKVLEEGGEEWFRLFFEALGDLGKSRPLPQTLVLVGGASGLEVLRKQTESDKLSRFTILGLPFKVLFFLPENIEDRIKTGAVDRKDPQMTLPLLLVLAASKYALE